MLLVASAGSMSRTLPVMAAAYFLILRQWLASVDRLSVHRDAATAQVAAQQVALLQLV